MKVYVNYPYPHFMIHGDLRCPDVQKQQKESQRIIVVNDANIGEVLKLFIDGAYKFFC